jgi:hypothetical protein
MFAITTKGGGMSNAMPDTCNTPVGPATVPIPYPNIASFTQSNPGTCTLKTKVMNQPVVTKATVVLMTSGDEGGVAAGLVSGLFKGPSKAVTYSMKVNFEGQAVVYQTCTIGQNGSSANAPAGIHSVPSQPKVTVMG